MTDAEMDVLFQALSHEHRRRMLDVVKSQPGIAVGALAGFFDVSRIAVMNHLAVLERANLVLSERDGRTRHLYLNAVPIQLIHERWMSQYSAIWAARLTGIKHAAEKATSKRRLRND